MTLAVPLSMAISPDDFDPPLKRTEASVPFYWTVEELANELEVSTRYVHYLIKGDPKKGVRIRLKAYRANNSLLIPDQDALQHLWNVRESKKNKT